MASNTAYISLRLPDRSTRRVLVAPGEVVLVGSQPDADRLTPLPGSIPAVTRTESIDVAGVSRNHLLLWAGTDGILFLDLGARNGSWVKLLPGVPIHAHGEDLAVLLGTPSSHQEVKKPPRSADWSDTQGFLTAVTQAVGDWLVEEADGQADVVLCNDAGESPTSPDFVPLLPGKLLHIRPQTTVDARWPSLLTVVWRYVEEQRRILEAEETSRDEGMVLASIAGRRAHCKVVEAARLGQRLILLGPSGSGKEGLARAYHRYSGRQGPFVAQNCAEVNRDLCRAELFGAEKGAFTGSVTRIPGVVEQANGGTLFLDEIGELQTDLQALLLRFLDRGEYTPIGAYGRPKQSDLRIVCATNRDLREDVRTGRFRQDLWFRLSTAVVEIPRLADRPEDIEAYLKGRVLNSTVSAFEALSAPALEVLRTHPLHGNFRELHNFVERLPRDASIGSIGARLCRELLQSGAANSALPPPPARSRSGDLTAWGTWSEEAMSAYLADHDGQHPQTWNHVQVYVEKYLKPLLLVGLAIEGGAPTVLSDPSGPQKVARQFADAVGADRGTASKHLARYLERFGESGLAESKPRSSSVNP
jgi:DNA-binding NtrC family response regulator